MKFFSIYVFPFVNNAAGWNGWLFNIFYDCKLPCHETG